MDTDLIISRLPDENWLLDRTIVHCVKVLALARLTERTVFREEKDSKVALPVLVQPDCVLTTSPSASVLNPRYFRSFQLANTSDRGIECSIERTIAQARSR